MGDEMKPPDPPAWVQAIIVAVGSLVGAFFFTLLFMVLFVPAMRHHHPPTLGAMLWLFIVPTVGAIIGGVFFSWASKR